MDRFLNKSLFIDTAPFIYFIEQHSKYQDKLLELFRANGKGDIIFQTSALTLANHFVLRKVVLQLAEYI